CKITLSPAAADLLINDESNIASEISARLSDNWRFQGDLLMDDNASTVEKGSASLRYNNGDNFIFNLAYRFTSRDNVLQPDIDQMDLSMSLPLGDNWKFLGRYNQDLNSNQELEIFAGLQYSSCCWRATVVARRWIERDDNILITNLDQLDHQTGIFFQIQFK